jgi:glycosylphosphatidylinositol transamidase (GPIT) subunit GPI8
MYYQLTLFDTSKFTFNLQVLANVYRIVNELENLSVDKVQNIATMCGVMCEVVLDAAEDIERVTNE